MITDYQPYLRVLKDGRIWWRLRDALRLGAGFVPVRDDQQMLETKLRAPNDRALLNERTLIGAFQDERLALVRPIISERDGLRYVDAEGFLAWLSQYIAKTQATEIAFPNELVREVKKARAQAAASQPPATSQEFESLTLALDGWFDKNLDDLPQALRQLVEREFFPSWGGFSPDQRQRRTVDRDYCHDPAAEQNREGWRKFFDDLGELQAKLQQWQTVTAPTADDLLKKESRIKELQREIDWMVTQEKQERSGYYPGRELPPVPDLTAYPAPPNSATKAEQRNEVPLMGRKAIADYLGVSESTVKNYMKNRRTFPFFSQGGRRCAYPSKLDEWREHSSQTRKKK